MPVKEASEKIVQQVQDNHRIFRSGKSQPRCGKAGQNARRDWVCLDFVGSFSSRKKNVNTGEQTIFLDIDVLILQVYLRITSLNKPFR